MCNILKHVEPAVHLFSIVQFASKRESGEQRASFSTDYRRIVRIPMTFSDTDTTFSSAIDVWVRDPPTVSILPAAAYGGLLDNDCSDQ